MVGIDHPGCTGRLLTNHRRYVEKVRFRLKADDLGAQIFNLICPGGSPIFIASCSLASLLSIGKACRIHTKGISKNVPPT